jgi:hypothetical protein
LLHVSKKFNVTVNQNDIRIKLSLFLVKHHTMRTYGGIKEQLPAQMKMSGLDTA